MVSNYCIVCLLNWAPYMTPNGSCPQCGSGTVRRQEPFSPEAVHLHKQARSAQQSLDRVAAFEVYYAEREARLNGLDRLPVVDESQQRRAA